MINVTAPDFRNTPASDSRPEYGYAPRGDVLPSVSIITPYYNMGSLFWETVRSVLRMSFTQWEWLIVDDGSVNPESLAQLERVVTIDPRIRVIRQPNGGPGVARNTAFANARGKYMFQLDCDDLIEPTFVEKAVWFLETQPQFGACGSFVVGFGAKEYTWSRGFQEYERNIDENTMTNIAVIRRSVWERMGGYDPAASYEHADWDFWLTMAESGWWGYTLPEHHSWYRIQARSLLVDIEGDAARAKAFRTFLHAKHQALRKTFPHPQMARNIDLPHSKIVDEIPVSNPLAKPVGKKRILLIVPWLEMGGAEKFDLRLIEALSKRGYEFTVATTLESSDPWLSQFTQLTPDVFSLHRFLNAADYPRFLNYLIESRQIDAVIMTQSKLAYLLAPYLRIHHPHLPMLDFTHIEEARWGEGGYPGIAVRIGRQLDLNVACTDHLKDWMVEQGGDPAFINVVHCNVDTHEWNPARYDSNAERARLGITDDTPLLLFAGRLVDQKRPLLFLQIMQDLVAKRHNFQAIIGGDGPMRAEVDHFISRHRLERYVRVLGSQSDDEMKRCMAAADVLVLPSDHEGLALVIYESMAMETVPVASLVGGQAELVTPETGFLIAKSPTERAEYVQAVERLITDPGARRRMATSARQRVIAEFDISLMADGMEAAIRQAADLAASRPPVAPDYEHARHIAHLAVEYMRITELADYLWSQRGLTGVQLKQSLRRRILPYDSRRFAVYKKIRQTALTPLRLLRRSGANKKQLAIAGQVSAVSGGEAEGRGTPTSATTLPETAAVIARERARD